MPAFYQRLRSLRRLGHLSTWRFLALVVTDPRWEPLYRSLSRGSPERRFDDPVPWLAWHSLAPLTGEIAQRRGAKILEWGSGASTLWYHHHGLTPTAIEHDPDWFSACQRYLRGKADLRLVPLGNAYVRPDLSLSDYAIIVIDGRDRNACGAFVCEAIEAGIVAPGTLIILDDSNRERYQPTIDRLVLLSRRHRTFSGPTSVEIDKTTTFFWV